MNKLVGTNISKTYQSGDHQTEVLSNVSISISEGDTLGVIGSSGSGKTTLLQILAGLEIPDQGDIFYNDINLSSNNARNFNSMRRNLFGYAYQFHYLLDDLTVFENCNLVFKIANNKKVDENFDLNQNEKQKRGRRNRFKSLIIEKDFEPENPKQLEELDENSCKWPIGHPEEEAFYFCGRSSLKDFSYCKLHLLYAYQPKGKKEDQTQTEKEDDASQYVEKKANTS